MSGTTPPVTIHKILPYIPVLFILLLALSCIRSYRRLRHFKGPFLGSFSSLWMAKTAMSGLMFERYTEVSRKYGPLARVGYNDLVTDDPEIIRHMSGARSKYLRSDWYDAMRMDPYIDNVMSTPDVGAHDRLRAKLAPGYAGKENPMLERDIDEQIAALVKLIRSKYVSVGGTVRPLDFGRTAQYFTLDVITKISYGFAFGYLEGDCDVHDYIKTTEELVPAITLCSSVPILQQITNSTWVRTLMGPSPKDKTGLGKLMAVAQEVVKDRFGAEKKDKMDMLGSFVRHGVGQRQAEAEVLFQIIAGSDTTATGMRATMLYLLTQPLVLQQLRAEIEDGIEAGRISSPITNAEALEMPYLQACIKEGLRIHPPFTGLVTKRAPPEGDVLHGQRIPGGTKIAHSTWAVQRNTAVFGEDVEVYRPERWLEASPEKKAQMQKTMELVFGYGRWGCLGKSIAFVELNKVFVELLRVFDMTIINPGRPWRSLNHNLFMQDHQWMKVTERGPSNT